MVGRGVLQRAVEWRGGGKETQFIRIEKFETHFLCRAGTTGPRDH